MGLNIKSARAEAAIRELAAQTGERLTDAVETAVRERLQRIKRQTPAESACDILETLKPIQQAAAVGRNEKRSSRQLLNELYDEHGLPT